MAKESQRTITEAATKSEGRATAWFTSDEQQWRFDDLKVRFSSERFYYDNNFIAKLATLLCNKEAAEELKDAIDFWNKP